MYLMSLPNYFLQLDMQFALEVAAMVICHPACDKQIRGWIEQARKTLEMELSPEIYEAAWRRGSAWRLD